MVATRSVVRAQLSDFSNGRLREVLAGRVVNTWITRSMDGVLVEEVSDDSVNVCSSHFFYSSSY